MTVENTETTGLGLDDDLEYTRRLKRGLTDTMFDEEGKLIQMEDPKMRDFALRVLDSMDKSALGRKRIEVEEGANEIARETNGFLAQLHSNAIPDPFRSETPVSRQIVLDIKPSDTATDIMLSHVADAGKTDYDNFTTTFLEDHPEYGD